MRTVSSSLCCFGSGPKEDLDWSDLNSDLFFSLDPDSISDASSTGDLDPSVRSNLGPGRGSGVSSDLNSDLRPNPEISRGILLNLRPGSLLPVQTDLGSGFNADSCKSGFNSESCCNVDPG